MLSDCIRELRNRVRNDGLPRDTAGFLLTLQGMEMEARNMEERIETASGRPHVPLDGRLMAMPRIEVSGLAVRP